MGDLASALDASLVKAFRTLLEAPRVGVRGAVMAFFAVVGAVCEEGID
jgi:hypothetical protein